MHVAKRVRQLARYNFSPSAGGLPHTGSVDCQSCLGSMVMLASVALSLLFGHFFVSCFIPQLSLGLIKVSVHIPVALPASPNSPRLDNDEHLSD